MPAEQNDSQSEETKQLLAEIEARTRRKMAMLEARELQGRMLGRTRYRRMLTALVLATVIYVPYCFAVSQLISDGYAVFVAFFAGAYLIVLGCFLYIDLPRGWRAFTYVVVITFVFLLLYLVGLPPRGPIKKDKAKEAEVKQNLHVIQLGVEGYALDHGGHYPLEIGTDFLASYASRYGPSNPFTEDHRNMQPVPLGAPDPWGDFSYVPELTDGEVTSYKLYAYGSEHTRGIDIDGDGEGDHVILVLSSGGEEPGRRKQD